MVLWGEWPVTSGSYGENALSFYRDGNLVRPYAVRDLVWYPQELPHSVSHYNWKQTHSLDSKLGELYVMTHNGEHYTFDLQTGNIKNGFAPTAVPEVRRAAQT